MAGTDRWTDCSHNMLFRLNDAKWREDLAKSGKAELVGYQEVGGSDTRKTLKSWCEEHKRGLYHPPHSGNPISWDQSVFAPHGPNGSGSFQGMVMVHPGARQYGIPSQVNPYREFTYLGLMHRAAKKSVLRINVHTLSGATKSNPEWTEVLSQFKNWGVQQYWLDVISFTAREMSRQISGAKSFKRFWDVILLGGDYNGDLIQAKDDEWYYPSQMLPALYVKDQVIKGLDHLQHAHGSDIRVIRRWAIGGNTDHRIHFATRDFIPVDDTPGA